MDMRIRKHAEVLMEYSLDVKQNEKILIKGDSITFPLIKECYRMAIKMGAYPKVQIENEELREILLRHGDDEQIKYRHEEEIAAVKSFDIFLSIMGTKNTRMLTSLNPEKIKISSQGNVEIMKIFMQRLKKEEIRMGGTLFPNNAHAQEANMSLSEYEDFVYNACFLNTPHPKENWQKIHNDQEKICEILNTKKTMRIVSKDTDLDMSIHGRKWINCAGKENLPDGEIFTGPVENSVNGQIRFSFPGIFKGREIEDIRLNFKNGRVENATATKGKELLHRILETDEGAKSVGEIAVGTNFHIKKFTRNMLFDEKIGGTVHLALGASFPRSLGRNQSSIHWDMLCDMRNGGKIYADDYIIYKNGKFNI